MSELIELAEVICKADMGQYGEKDIPVYIPIAKAVLAHQAALKERELEIDTFVKDCVTAYLKRYITHADEVLLNRAPLSKGQLLRYVQHQRDVAEKGLSEIEEIYSPAPEGE